MLLMLLVLMGLIAGGYHPASTPLISLSCPPQSARARARTASDRRELEFFLAPLIAGRIAAAWGWRGALSPWQSPTIILGFFFFLFMNKHYGKTHIEAMKQSRWKNDRHSRATNVG